MSGKTERSAVWLEAPSTQDMWDIASFERDELILEALDCLEYAEEKLLELEFARQNISCIRRLQGTFVRLYELAWMLQAQTIFSLVQKVRAFLTYARQEDTAISREDINELFSLCSVLQELYAACRRVQPEEALAAVAPHLYPCEWQGKTVSDAALEQSFQHSLGWIAQRLRGVEAHQEEQAQIRSVTVNSALVRSLSTQMADFNQTAQAVLPGRIANDDHFAEEVLPAASQELVSLQKLVGELDTNLAQLREQLAIQNGVSPSIEGALSNLISLQQTLKERVELLSARPVLSSSLFGLVVGFQERLFLFPTSSIQGIYTASDVELVGRLDTEQGVLLPDGRTLPLYTLRHFLPTLEAVQSVDLLEVTSASRPEALALRTDHQPSQEFVVLLHTPDGVKACWVEHLLREMMVDLLVGRGAAGDIASVRGCGRLPDGQSVWLLEPACLVEKVAVAS